MGDPSDAKNSFKTVLGKDGSRTKAARLVCFQIFRESVHLDFLKRTNFGGELVWDFRNAKKSARACVGLWVVSCGVVYRADPLEVYNGNPPI